MFKKSNRTKSVQKVINKLVRIDAVIKSLVAAAKTIYPDKPILQQVVVCQAILESNYLGKPEGSDLARLYNNLFGIKGKGDKGSVKLPTWEDNNGSKPGGVVKVRDNFAVYSSQAACMARHREMMQWKIYRKVWEASTLTEACRGLQGVWATDGNYAKKLEQIYTNDIKSYFS